MAEQRVNPLTITDGYSVEISGPTDGNLEFGAEPLDGLPLPPLERFPVEMSDNLASWKCLSGAL
jgi:hypothetical protein